MSKLQERKGITLVSLVVTIIILLILSAVAINLAVNTDGLFSKAGDAANKWNTAIGQEETDINDILDIMDSLEPKPMVTKWSVAAGETVDLPVANTGEYNITVDWGDGSEIEAYSSGATSTVNLNGDVKVTKLVNDSSNVEVMPIASGDTVATHSYTNAGEYDVTITGIFTICNGFRQESLIEIVQWGENEATGYYFGYCSNLEKIASTSKNTFKNVTDFSNTFEECTSMTSIPDGLFANCSNVTTFDSTFKGCTGLTNIGNYVFADCINVISFYSTFKGCTGLTSIPDNMFSNCVNVTNFDATFKKCTALTSIPGRLFADCVNVLSFGGNEGVSATGGTFESCEALTSIPEELFANCVNVTNFTCTFASCSALESLPQTLFDNCSVASFYQTFYRCSSLTGNAIPLWERWDDEAYAGNSFYGTPEQPTGYGCYDGCYGVNSYTDIPGRWR